MDLLVYPHCKIMLVCPMFLDCILYQWMSLKSLDKDLKDVEELHSDANSP